MTSGHPIVPMANNQQIVERCSRYKVPICDLRRKHVVFIQSAIVALKLKKKKKKAIATEKQNFMFQVFP